jgi:hypothetical protein
LIHPPFNKDVDWCETKMREVQEIYRKKNRATYVGVVDGQILNPLASISKEDSERAISEAHEALKAHWASESLSNPKLRSEQVAGGNGRQAAARGRCG